MNPKVCQLPQPGLSQIAQPAARSAADLRGDFSETFAGLSAEQARDLAGGCLSTLTCLYCEVCQLMCPDQCITRDDQTGHIRFSMDHCKGCGLCAHFCPKGAIQMVVEPK